MSQLYFQNTDNSSLLRSILLFDNVKDKKNIQKSKKDLMQKTVLAIVLQCSEEGTAVTRDIVIKVLRDRFGNADSDNIESVLNSLCEKKLIAKNMSGVYSVVEKTESLVFFTSLETRTESLISEILFRTETIYGHRIEGSVRERVKENIKKAMTLYYMMFSYSFFDIAMSPEEHATENAVMVAKQGIEERLGNSLVRGIALTLKEASGDLLDTIEMWAKAYVALQMLNLDPNLRNLKASKMKDKVFICDTDVVLYCITDNASKSTVYKLMVSRLKSLGCKVIVPASVISEITAHASAARKRFAYEGQTLRHLSPEVLETEIANVFIEDYVKTIRLDSRKSDMPFKSYLDNICDEQIPSILENKIKKCMLTEMVNEELDFSSIKFEEIAEMTEVLLQKTEKSKKGELRPTEQNREICESDASLYLYVYGLSDTSTHGVLSRKTYLVTSMKKIISAARNLGLADKIVVCSPESLSAILVEIGEINTKGYKVIDLFDNPFLSYTAEAEWAVIKPVLDAKKELKYKDLDRLREDVDTTFDMLLTADNEEDRRKELMNLQKRGYFTEDIVEDISKELESERKKNKTQAATIEELKALLEAERIKNRALEKIAPRVKSTGKTVAKKSRRK